MTGSPQLCEGCNQLKGNSTTAEAREKLATLSRGRVKVNSIGFMATPPRPRTTPITKEEESDAAKWVHRESCSVRGAPLRLADLSPLPLASLAARRRLAT